MQRVGAAQDNATSVDASTNVIFSMNSQWKPTKLARIDLLLTLVCAVVGFVLLLIGALLCLRLCTQTPSTPCGPGWAHHGGHCYKLLENKSFIEADHACRFDHGAQLASIHSETELEYVALIAADPIHVDHLGAWIGLHRPAGMHSTWQWLDGSELDYTHWSDIEEMQPEYATNHQRWCVMIVNRSFRSHMDWIFLNCETRGQSAVCKKES